jgi:uncharacterized Ntn-hydrolase superfamily protein
MNGRPLAPTVATFSIVATDGVDWGVAVASKFLAVGAVVPAAAAAVGAVATQAMSNASYKRRGLALLAQGRYAADVVELLTENDPDRHRRQVGVVDRDGGAASYTGSQCLEWAGGDTATGCACQGNLLAGPEVVEAMLSNFGSADGPLSGRLLAALAAGDLAGGDRRGRQSAALLVVRADGGYGGFDDRMIDLRVDDHRQPIAELERLLRSWRTLFERPDPATLLAAGPDLVARIRRALIERGLVRADRGQEEVMDAFEAWAKTENLEERWAGRSLIDPAVLSHLEGSPDPSL